jgi:predicted RecA/RadA family phage recombinase
MLNQLYPDGDVIQLLAPAAVTSGMPVLIGTMPAVAIDAYVSATVPVSFALKGVYALTVVARSIQSPVSGLAIKPGEELFATGGTLDAATNITTGIEINKTRGGVPFGMYFGAMPGILSGVTDTAAPVRLNQQATNDLV